jgi:hypothetical protein
MRLRFDSLVPDDHSSPPILVILSRTRTSDSPTNGSDDKFFTLTSYMYSLLKLSRSLSVTTA